MTHRFELGMLLILAVVLGLHGASCAGQEAAPASANTNESITNTQEEGVDEGGIVKAWGDHLIVLRRGRLFTVRLGDQDLQPVCMVNAFPPRRGERLGTWYDELLVHDNTVVVIGYSYRARATELGIFDLDDSGCISHRDTYFLRSNDYYSSRNYASRLAHGRLIFYMPHSLGSYEVGDGAVTVSSPLPSLRRYDGRIRGGDWNQLITASDIRLPTTPVTSPTLHTVVSCDLRSSDFRCTAHGVIGSFGRTFYVSREAVYVWVTEGRRSLEASDPPGVVYRLPLDGSAPGALRVWGAPIDQFSFMESADGHLNVLVRNNGGGDWMANPEFSFGAVALARLPLTAFSEAGSTRASTGSYTLLPSPPNGYIAHNRFVGDWILYGSHESRGWFRTHRETRLFIHPVGRQGETTTMELAHGIERIEALNDDAVVVGSGDDGLTFSTLALSEGHPEVIDQFVQRGARQGEQRSHGFFYREESDRQGLVGLPMQFAGSRWSFLGRSSAAVLFLEVDQLHFSRLGSLNAGSGRVDDNCQVSCVDWYGNSRPIFYRGRIFALMGYELVEGTIRDESIVEVGRTHMIRRLPRG